MSIVFGWNNFKIKSFEPYELGLTNNLQSDFTIEARQSYFHLFWIPCFGLGKKWNIRKGGQLYELPAAYAHAIQQQNVRVRSPWYTYLLPIIGMLGLLGFGVSEKYKAYKWEQYEKNEFETKAETLTQQMNAINTKDIIKIENEKGERTYLKAEKIKSASILFSKFITDKSSEYDESNLYIENYYLQHPAYLDSVEIEKSSLLNAIPKIYNKNMPAYMMDGANLVNKREKHVISEIVRHFQPNISDRGTGGYSDKTISMDFLNSGWPCTLIEIKNLEGNINWVVELPMRIDSPKEGRERAFELSGENYKKGTKYKFEMTFKDTTNAIYKYNVEGENLDKTIKCLN
jgi:hypothetical protein